MIDNMISTPIFPGVSRSVLNFIAIASATTVYVAYAGWGVAGPELTNLTTPPATTTLNCPDQIHLFPNAYQYTLRI